MRLWVGYPTGRSEGLHSLVEGLRYDSGEMHEPALDYDIRTRQIKATFEEELVLTSKFLVTSAGSWSDK